MANDDEKLRQAADKIRLPIVTLDNKWHKIWSMVEKPSDVAKNETKLNDLLRKQGKLNTESKEIKKLKKKLMDEIVNLMDDSSGKVDEKKRLIEECNEKLDSFEEKLAILPGEIEEVNRELMYSTMEQCYHVLHENEKEIDSLAGWIRKIRIELKKNVVRKQEKEIQNAIMYSYMHDIFGPDVINLFDMKNDPMEKLMQLKASVNAAEVDRNKASK